MAKSEEIFLTGVNLSDGRRFEAGQKVPSDLSKEDAKALKEMGVVGKKEDLQEV